MNESDIRDAMVIHGKSLFNRGYTAGGSGNISARVSDGCLLTPTNSCLGRLTASRIAKIDHLGNHIDGDPPSKEAVLHAAVYRARPETKAIVHLHSPYAVAVSCLEGLDPNDVLPPLTPYFVMRIGRLPMIPYFPPGDIGLADAVANACRTHRAVLMAHHGTVATGKSIDDAVYAAEELEETARLFFLLRDHRHRALDKNQVAELEKRFPG